MQRVDWLAQLVELEQVTMDLGLASEPAALGPIIAARDAAIHAVASTVTSQDSGIFCPEDLARLQSAVQRGTEHLARLRLENRAARNLLHGFSTAPCARSGQVDYTG